MKDWVQIWCLFLFYWVSNSIISYFVIWAESLSRTLCIWLKHINWQLIFRVNRQNTWIHLSGCQTNCQKENKQVNSIHCLFSFQMVCSVFFLRDSTTLFIFLWLMISNIHFMWDLHPVWPKCFTYEPSMISPGLYFISPPHQYADSVLSTPLEFCCPIDSISPTAHGNVFKQLFRITFHLL